MNIKICSEFCSGYKSDSCDTCDDYSNFLGSNEKLFLKGVSEAVNSINENSKLIDSASKVLDKNEFLLSVIRRLIRLEAFKFDSEEIGKLAVMMGVSREEMIDILDHV